MEPTTQIFQAQPFKVGQLIAGRYRVVAFLGAGSMGWVLKVEDEALAGAVVALKVLYPHLSRDRTSALRFRQEVVLARQLAHPSIIHVHDFEESADGETFIALEYVEGASLDSILKEQNGQGLPFDEAILILARMGEALLYAHQQGVLHRDLKPSNILVGRDGAIKLTDFGLAKSFQQEFGLTRTGEALGTPLYMAPEQFRAEATDQRTDIYAFGILAYELVAGTPPFRGDDFFALAEQHITTPPTFENKRIASAPPWFQALIRHCCEKKPADRPISMVEVLPLLTEKLAGSTQLTVALRYATPTRRFSRRAQRTIFALVTTAILLGLAALAWQQTNTRVFICSRVLTAEYRMGIEVPLLKRLLNLLGSLLRPQSAFEALHDEGGVLLHFLLTANKLLRDDGEPIEPLANLRDAAGYTLLQRAVQTNAWRIVDPFTDKDLDFNLTDPNGDTAFIATLKGNKVHTYTSLLTNKYFRIDGPDAAGDLPLHIAVRLGNVGAVDHMLREVKNSGASLRNAKGEHILHLAARLPNSAILAQLLAAGVDPTVRDREGRTVLMEAVRTKGPAHETEALIRILFQPRFRQAGVDIHALDNHGTNALMYALEAQNELAVRKLIAAGAKLEQRNDAGLTAYDYARQSGMLHLLPPELQ